ncbi:MAG: copper resistance protein CopC [Dehalococcoidia bacterium]
MSSACGTLRRRFTALALGAVLTLLLATQFAFAHATPVRFAPAQDAVLNAAPMEVSIETASPMAEVAKGNSIVVHNAAGATIDTTDATIDAPRTRMSVHLPHDLVPGAYTAHWSTVSEADGEPDSGSWTFTYDPAAAPRAGAQPTSPPSRDAGANIALVAPADGATVNGPSVTLEITLTNVALVEIGESGDESTDAVPGHLHVMVDGRQLGMLSHADGITVTDLADGAHTIVVELVAPSHASYDPPITAMARFTVAGSDAEGSPRLDTAAQAAASATDGSGSGPGALVVGAGVLGAFVAIAVAVIVGGRLAASRRR